MLKPLVFSLMVLHTFSGSSQTNYNHFVELTYAGTDYNSICHGTQNAWNSGFGITVNRSLTRIVSFEMAYHNAWINETIQNVNYRLIAHWTALHLCFGKDFENCSLRLLIGPSFGTRGVGADLGTRFTRSGIAVDSGTYPEPLSAYLFFNANLGLAWHFNAK